MYSASGAVLRDVIVRKQGLKSSLYRIVKGKSSKVLRPCLALVTTVLDHRDELDELLKKDPLKRVLKMGSRWVIMAMVADHLYSMKGIRGSGNLIRELSQALEELGIQKGTRASQNKKDGARSLRYLRVDLNRMAREQAVVALSNILRPDHNAPSPNVSADDDGTGTLVTIDPLIPDVISVDSKYAAELTQQGLVKTGVLTMMDRSTCLTAHVLKPKAWDVIIDVCAAPGSKTLHFISALKGKGLVIAIEYNRGRYQTLVDRIQKESMCTNKDVWEEQHHVLRSDDGTLVTVALNVDVMEMVSCNRTCYKCVCHRKKCINYLVNKFHPVPERDGGSIQVGDCVLSVDPTCSGSGLDERVAEVKLAMKEKDDELIGRVRLLHSFQLKVLKRIVDWSAVSRFVYSTCSLWVEENEEVVQKVIDWETTRGEKIVQLAPIDAIKGWENSKAVSVDPSKELKPQSWWQTSCRRSDQNTHRCRGFFLSLFERI